MIIDDDPLTLYIVRKQLSVSGEFDPMHEFGNAEMAIEYLQRMCDIPGKLPDLILLDIYLPVIDGWQFLDLVSTIEFSKEVKVVILSVAGKKRDLERAKTYKIVSQYILKPLNVQVLQEV